MSKQKEKTQEETALVVLPEPYQKDLQKAIPLHDKNSQEAVTVAQSIVIQTDEDQGKAADVIAKIKDQGKAVEAIRKEIGDPFRKMVEYVNGKLKPISDRFVQAENLIKTKVVDYVERKEKAIREENERIRKINEENERKRIKAEMDAQVSGKPYKAPAAQVIQQPIPTAPATTVGEGGGKLGTRKKWTFDPEKTNLEEVPRQYLMLNDKVVQATIDSGTRKIPGIHIYEKTIIASGGR